MDLKKRDKSEILLYCYQKFPINLPKISKGRVPKENGIIKTNNPEYKNRIYFGQAI